MADIHILSEFILSFEGGFSNHPADRGGATNRGVTLFTWRTVGYDKNGDGCIDVNDLRLLTQSDVVEKVLRPHYWNRWAADKIDSQSVANICVDWVWGSGKAGITEVQKLLGVTRDGIVGPKTLASLNGQDPENLFNRIKQIRRQFIERLCSRNPSQQVFRRGWLRRLDSLSFGSLTLNDGKQVLFAEK